MNRRVIQAIVLALILTLLAVTPQPVKAPESEGSSLFYVIVASDTHIGYSNHALEMLSLFVNVSNIFAEANPPPAYVVVTGDLTEHGDYSEYKTFFGVMKRLKVPLLVVPGNHETYARDVSYTQPEKGAVLRERFLEFTGYSDTMWYVKVGDVALIGLDTVDWTHKYTSVLGVVTEDRLSKLRGFLEKAKSSGARVAIVFAHHPPKGATPFNDMVYGSEKLLSTLETYARDMTVVYQFGHVHVNWMGTYKGVYLACVTSLAKPRQGTRESFAVIAVYRGVVSESIVPLTPDSVYVAIISPQQSPWNTVKYTSEDTVEFTALVVSRSSIKEVKLLIEGIEYTMSRVGNTSLYSVHVPMKEVCERVQKGPHEVKFAVVATDVDGRVGYIEGRIYVVGTSEKVDITLQLITALAILVPVAIAALYALRKRK